MNGSHMSMADGSNASLLLHGEVFVIGVQTGFFAVIRDEFHGPAIQVADQRDVLVSLRHRFLVHSQARNDPAPLGLHAAFDRTLQEAPRFVPTDPQETRSSQDIGFEQRIDRVLLEGHRATSSRQRPRQSNLPDAVKQTGDSWNPRPQPSQPRAVIQMSPATNRRMIVQRQNDTAFGAPKPRIASMAKKDIDGLCLGIEVHKVDRPRP